ncbi:MAG TPA: hypothetical protein VF386_08955 [Usitatibacter sp.]|jgi:hypothetical protein
MRWIVLLILMLGAAQARAYCIHNQLKDRDVSVEQETHPDALRDDRRMRVTLKPGESKCCQFHELDCNPGGRSNSVVKLLVQIPGTPEYECTPPGPDPLLKVTGSGSIRIQPNPRKSANPYIVRIATLDKDLTGPSGVPCQEPKSKQVSPPKGKK